MDVFDDASTRREILNDIAQERARQLEKWGVQRHSDGVGVQWDSALGAARLLEDMERREGNLSWAAILREEVYEALASTDPYGLIEELTQVAAVCVAWLEDLYDVEAPTEGRQ